MPAASVRASSWPEISSTIAIRGRWASAVPATLRRSSSSASAAVAAAGRRVRLAGGPCRRRLGLRLGVRVAARWSRPPSSARSGSASAVAVSARRRSAVGAGSASRRVGFGFGSGRGAGRGRRPVRGPGRRERGGRRPRRARRRRSGCPPRRPRSARPAPAALIPGPQDQVGQAVGHPLVLGPRVAGGGAVVGVGRQRRRQACATGRVSTAARPAMPSLPGMQPHRRGPGSRGPAAGGRGGVGAQHRPPGRRPAAGPPSCPRRGPAAGPPPRRGPGPSPGRRPRPASGRAASRSARPPARPAWPAAARTRVTESASSPRRLLRRQPEGDHHLIDGPLADLGQRRRAGRPRRRRRRADLVVGAVQHRRRAGRGERRQRPRLHAPPAGTAPDAPPAPRPDARHRPPAARRTGPAPGTVVGLERPPVRVGLAAARSTVASGEPVRPRSDEHARTVRPASGPARPPPATTAATGAAVARSYVRF